MTLKTLGLRAAGALCALALGMPSVMAYEHAPGDVLYVMCDNYDRYNVSQTPLVLYQSEEFENIYSGYLRWDIGQFLFYTQFNEQGVLDADCIGNAYGDSPVQFYDNATTYAGEISDSYGLWWFEGDYSPWVKVVVNLEQNSVEFERVSVVDIAVKAVSDNVTVNGQSFSAEGDAEVLFEATMSNGDSCTLSPIGDWYSVNGPANNGGFMDSGSQISEFELCCSKLPLTVSGCTTDEPVNVVFKNEYRNVRVKRSNFDVSTLKFELREDVSTDLYASRWYDIYTFIDFEFGFDEDQFYVELISGDAEINGRGFAPIGAGELTMAFGTYEYPDKRVEVTFTVMPEYPEAYTLYTVNDALEYTPTDIVLNQTAEGIFTATITIPEGEGDFNFVFGTTPEQFEQGIYVIFSNGEPAFDLTGNICSRYAQDDFTNIPFSIPAEFRGQTKVFRINFQDRRLAIYNEDYNPDVVNFIAMEDNPEYIVKNNTALYRFQSSTTDFEFEFEDGAYWVQGTWYESIDDYNKIVSMEVYAGDWGADATVMHVYVLNPETGERTEIYSQEIQSLYVPVESVEIDPDTNIYVGEYAEISYTVVPEINSQSVRFWAENNGNNQLFDTGDRLYILGQESAVIVCHLTSDNGEEYASSTVTVLPREAKPADHMFHATLEVGHTLNLNLSAHNIERSEFAEAAWSTGDESVATVDENGVVTAVGPGRTVITADCGEHQAVMGVMVSGGEASEITPETQSVKVFASKGTIYVNGLGDGDTVKIYDTAGHMLHNKTVSGSTESFKVGSGVYIIATGKDVFKIGL